MGILVARNLALNGCSGVGYMVSLMRLVFMRRIPGGHGGILDLALHIF